MSYTNLTPVQIGMTGRLADKSYRVAGRVVMGMDDAGQTYYWNEFNLVSDDNDSITLVYEVTERGGEWRLFTLFEPDQPMSVQEAAAKRVGDTVNFDGSTIPITLVDESRVYYIEGHAPEGVEVGDVARYFNAESGNHMVVVSWTGEEIEFYRGVDLPRGTVASAFNLGSKLESNATVSGIGANFLRGDATSFFSSALPSKMVAVVLGVAVLIGVFAIRRTEHSQSGIQKVRAPAAPLVVGSNGVLDGNHYRVQAHALVEIGEVGQVYDRHEYILSSDDGTRALVIYGSKPRAKDWILFTPVEPATRLTPQQAAAVRVGDMVNLDGHVATVGEKFQSVIRESDGPESSDLRTGAVLFGFLGQSGSTLLLARWDERGIDFYRGEVLPEKEAIAAFSPGARN